MFLLVPGRRLLKNQVETSGSMDQRDCIKVDQRIMKDQGETVQGKQPIFKMHGSSCFVSAMRFGIAVDQTWRHMLCGSFCEILKRLDIFFGIKRSTHGPEILQGCLKVGLPSGCETHPFVGWIMLDAASDFRLTI